jgi:hypothetical protein
MLIPVILSVQSLRSQAFAQRGLRVRMPHLEEAAGHWKPSIWVAPHSECQKIELMLGSQHLLHRFCDQV